MTEYGPVALGTYLTIFGLTWAGFATALSMGVHVESAAGGAGLAGASWLATKVTQPLRIGATALLTPIVAGFTRRTKRSAPNGLESTDEAETLDPAAEPGRDVPT